MHIMPAYSNAPTPLFACAAVTPLCLSSHSGEGTFPRKLVLVGDPDQLPPVSAGQPVADALAEGLLPCVDLRQIYRTAANSAIVASAHAINKGEQGMQQWVVPRCLWLLRTMPPVQLCIGVDTCVHAACQHVGAELCASCALPDITVEVTSSLPLACLLAVTYTGLRPNFSAVWDINPSNIAADIAHHISMAQATQPDSLALEGGKVLYLRLPDGCAPYAVAAALKETAQQLLPLLPCDQTLDVQVGCGWGRRGCLWLVLA